MTEDEYSPTFLSGELVAGRYRIERFIARGGAGEVYEAFDTELDGRVALKTVRGDRTEGKAIERFKREINLARQVTHPNICRIYEFGRHQPDGQASGDIYFLTMEFLEGENLYDRLQMRGRMSPDEALAIVKQMISGLEAAWRAGVIHRDFKTGNVVLVPDLQEPSGTRAVLTDFGLARGADRDSHPRLTAHNQLVGTPIYMAPEQVAGEPLTHAADIYALGVVMYEMLTGNTPFDSDSPLATAVQRLTEPASSPRLYRPDLPETWEQAILRCLERQPGKRFANGRELLAVLDPTHGGSSSSETITMTTIPQLVPAPAEARRRIPMVIASLLAAIGLIAALTWLVMSRDDTPPTEIPAGAESARRALAVLGFKNLSARAEADWLSTALAEMLAMEAAAGDQLRVIPGDSVTQARLELGWDDARELAATELERFGTLLDCDLAVVGSYFLASGDRPELRLDVLVRNVIDGSVVARVSERGSEDQILALVESAGASLRAALDVEQLSSSEVEAVRAALPSDAESARLYAEGLDRLRRYDAQAAVDALRQAAEIDANNPLIHSALASAWSQLGYRPRAREAARRAVELSDGLSRRDRLWVEGSFYDTTGQRQEAIDSYRRLWDYFPDTVHYGLRLARAQISAGDTTAAAATVAKLRQRPISSRSGASRAVDPRIDLVEAQSARSVADYQRQQRLAARAAKQAKQVGDGLLAARAKEVEAGAWRDLGDHEQALDAYSQARKAYLGAGDRGAVARVLIAIAKIHRHQGQFDDARPLIEEALTVAREIGDQGSIQHALNTLAIISRQQGRLDEALEMHELELAANRQAGDERSIQIALTSVGVVERSLGRLEAAEKHFEEALTMARASGHKRSMAINLNLLAEVLLRRGQLSAARQHVEEALVLNRDTNSPRGRAYYLATLGDIEAAAGDTEAAIAHHREALALRRDLGEETNTGYSLLSLARLELRRQTQAAAATAADAAHQAADIFAAEDKIDTRGAALAILARARHAAGHDDAVELIDEALELTRDSQNDALRLRAEIDAAALTAARGDTATAARRARQAATTARQLGFVDLELAAEAVAATGDPAARKALEARTTELGYQGLLD